MRKTFRKKRKKQTTKYFPYNERIRTEELFVIDENNQPLGQMNRDEALQKAQERGFDLVLVSPQVHPPVAKFLDYGKFKYKQEKQAQKQKSKHKKTEIKGIRLTFLIGKHDLETRAQKAKEFIEDGDKLKIEMVLRGREHQHTNKAKELLEEFIKRIGDESQLVVEQPIKKQGGKLVTIIAPKK